MKALFFNTEQSMSEHFLLELVTSYQSNPEALSSQLQDIPYQKITESGSAVQKLSASRKSRFISPSRFFRTMIRTLGLSSLNSVLSDARQSSLCPQPHSVPDVLFC